MYRRLAGGHEGAALSLPLFTCPPALVRALALRHRSPAADYLNPLHTLLPVPRLFFYLPLLILKNSSQASPGENPQPTPGTPTDALVYIHANTEHPVLLADFPVPLSGL